MFRYMQKIFFAISLLLGMVTIVLYCRKTFFPIRPTFENICYQTYVTSKLTNRTATHVNKEQIEHAANGFCSNHICPAPIHSGKISVNTDAYDFENVVKNELAFVKNGGWWLPTNCIQETSVAILVPYRDRPKHLEILLRHLHPILYRQQLHYRLFIIQQDENHPFNRGKLFNVGVLEALKMYPFNCIIMHDVDLLPEDDRIDYGCTLSPALLSMLIDKFKYKALPEQHFGGVTSMTTKHYFKVNGFTNKIYAWGGEDDDLYKRLGYERLRKQKKNPELYRYTMLKHVDRKFSRTPKETIKVKKVIADSRKYYQTDGVNSAVYRVNKIMMEPLYTLIDVNLMREKSTL